MTIVDTLYDAHYGSRERLGMALAGLLNEEARELEALGVDWIQLDEPAFNVYMDEVRDWGLAALDRAVAGLTCRTAVHICYGYGIKANIDWKKTLGGEWRQYERTFPLLARSRIGGVSLECANSHVPLDLLALLEGKDVLVGAIDVATAAVETPEEVAAVIRSRPSLRAARAALPLHELRHGAARPRRGTGQAPRPRRRSRAGPPGAGRARHAPPLSRRAAAHPGQPARPPTPNPSPGARRARGRPRRRCAGRRAPERGPVPGSIVMPWAWPARSFQSPHRFTTCPRRSSSSAVPSGKRPSRLSRSRGSPMAKRPASQRGDSTAAAGRGRSRSRAV